MRKLYKLFCSGMLCFYIAVAGGDINAFGSSDNLAVLASTFPIYQITRNVTSGRDGVTVSLMIPAQLGCPHDYTLTPGDMRKLARADVLILNGLGMEEYLGAPVEKANPKLKILDSSAGIKDILRYADGKDSAQSHAEAPEEEHLQQSAQKDRHAHEYVGEPDHAHNAGDNPHLFASPRMVALLTMNIADALSKIDPAGAEVYSRNARAYADNMNRLAEEFSALGRKLVNNRIVTQHGVFDYLARDMGLSIVAVLQAHAGQEPAASEMLEIVKTIRREQAGAVFTEPQYPQKIGRTIAKEAGIAAATLDPVATGPETAPLEYYETRMRQNLLTLEKILGTR